jgi:DNA-directed RNA polymerase specialized sigma24 family protein
VKLGIGEPRLAPHGCNSEARVTHAQEVSGEGRAGHSIGKDPVQPEERHELPDRVRTLQPRVRSIMDEMPAARPREVVHLYVFEGLSQRQTTERPGISHQSVTERHHGAFRDGHAVGATLRKYRKQCTRRGV